MHNVASRVNWRVDDFCFAHGAAANVVNNLLDTHTHWDFDKAGILDLADQAEYFGT